MALALLVALPAGAQTSEHDTTSTPGHALRLPTIVFASAAAADEMTTYRTLAPGPGHPLGGIEHAPWLAPFGNRPIPTVIGAAAIDVTTAWVLDRCIGRHHPKVAAVALYGLAGMRTFIAARNNYRLRQIP